MKKRAPAPATPKPRTTAKLFGEERAEWYGVRRLMLTVEERATLWAAHEAGSAGLEDPDRKRWSWYARAATWAVSAWTWAGPAENGLLVTAGLRVLVGWALDRKGTHPILFTRPRDEQRGSLPFPADLGVLAVPLLDEARPEPEALVAVDLCGWLTREDWSAWRTVWRRRSEVDGVPVGYLRPMPTWSEGVAALAAAHFRETARPLRRPVEPWTITCSDETAPARVDDA